MSKRMRPIMPAGKPLNLSEAEEFEAELRAWGGSLVVLVPAWARGKMGLKAGETVKVMIRR